MKLWRYQYPAQKAVDVALNPARSYWLQVVKGNLEVNGVALHTSDALALKQEERLSLTTQSECEFLLFDLV